MNSSSTAAHGINWECSIYTQSHCLKGSEEEARKGKEGGRVSFME
jgi:hypothetical protein